MSKPGNHDSLTGLYCRSAYEVDKTSAAFDARVVGAIVIDFDQFSRVNREYGRAIGDFILAMQAERLNSLSCCYSRNLYRYEGDRFLQLIFADTAVEPQDLEAIAADIQQTLNRDIHLSRQSISVSCSVSAVIKPYGVALNRVVTEAFSYIEKMKEQRPNPMNFVCPSMGAGKKVS